MTLPVCAWYVIFGGMAASRKVSVGTRREEEEVSGMVSIPLIAGSSSGLSSSSEDASATGLRAAGSLSPRAIVRVGGGGSLADPRALRSIGDGTGVSPLGVVNPFPTVISVCNPGLCTDTALRGGMDLGSRFVGGVTPVTLLWGKGGGGKEELELRLVGSKLGSRDAVL